MNTTAQHNPEAFSAFLLQAWQGVIDPLTQKPLIHAKNLHVTSHAEAGTAIATAQITLPYYPAHAQTQTLERHLRAALQNTHLASAASGSSGIPFDKLAIRFISKVIAHAVPAGVPLVPNVKNMIAVSSAKGGVGKSTTAVNLALALAAQGAYVGVLDADIYGPSIPALLRLSGKQPEVNDKNRMVPLQNYGIQAMSIGMLVTEEDRAMIWRAPMALRALNQLLTQTQWGNEQGKALDYLIVDMPPGTGDIQLTMNQRMPLTGAVVVTTPQDIALLDVQKGVTMFQKMQIPVLGILENMAMHTCSQCGHQEHIFGVDGGKKLAQSRNIPYLGAMPLTLQIRQQSDAGVPVVFAQPDGAIAQLYKQAALTLAAQIATLPADHSHKFPPIQVQPS